MVFILELISLKVSIVLVLNKLISLVTLTSLLLITPILLLILTNWLDKLFTDYVKELVVLNNCGIVSLI